MCLTLNFSIYDEYAAGDFDSRIGNDVLLTVFKDGAVVASSVIPHEYIHNGKCTVKKPDGMDGNVELLVWGVPNYTDGTAQTWYYDPLQQGVRFEDIQLEYSPTRAVSNLLSPSSFYYGTENAVADKSELTSAAVQLSSIMCRVEVRMHTTRQLAVPSVKIQGTASKANLRGEGIGNDQIVAAPLQRQTGSQPFYGTGLINVMPSRKDQSVSVIIMDDNNNLTTLTTPRDVPVAAISGGYILFDYYEESASVTITVNDYEMKGEIVTM
ncbi:MAG: FimB/Mfa2 family fimbrial subunit [Mediterranea sp.]|nr:FimB/Mfa2 family fimbrial subunit [Mediterranea sp.]